jgi:hypothetical protein
MMDNPLQPDPMREERIRERAYHMWEQEGRPPGRDREYWERAAELIGMEDSAGAGQLPNPQTHPARNEVAPGMLVEEADIQQNLGEFPDRVADQGEHPATPEARHSPRHKAPSLDNQPPTASVVPELPAAEDTVEDLPDAAGAAAPKKPARKTPSRKKA